MAAIRPTARWFLSLVLLVLVHGRRRFLLRPDAVGVRVDIAGAVAAAVADSRRGTFLGRVYREVRGTRLDVSLEPRVRYAPRRLTAFVRRS